MKLLILSPTKAFLTSYTEDELFSLGKQLTYENSGVKHLIKRHYASPWRRSNPESWERHLETLKKDLKRCLLFEEDGKFYIRPGSIPHLTGLSLEVTNEITYPIPKKIPWLKPIPFELHPEQEVSWTKLIEEKHGNACLCTGFGKSYIIVKICRELGLPTCIVVPSKSIFEELVQKFEYHFGKKHVGTFGAGKKKFEGKRFVIAIGDSLANIVPGSEEYKFFNSLDALIVDEAHSFGAESLEEVCHGVLSNIPYRMLVSATMERNDGSGALLNSIIGKTVCTLKTEDAIKKGYICPHEFRIVSVESSDPANKETDPLAVKRVHLLNNSNIASFIAKLSNAMATQGKQTLILCEELRQLSMLIPLLKVPFAVAHSERNAAKLESYGLEKVEVQESIEKFNKNEVKVLVTSSCCHVGVNMYPTHSTVNWCGGSSHIKVKQAAIGRSVRLGRSNPWADKCVPKDKAIIYDFDVENNKILTRHLESRIECYNESGPGLIKYVRLKKT